MQYVNINPITGITKHINSPSQPDCIFLKLSIILSFAHLNNPICTMQMEVYISSGLSLVIQTRWPHNDYYPAKGELFPLCC